MAKTLEERSRSTYGGPKRPKPISENERRIDQINGPFLRPSFSLSLPSFKSKLQPSRGIAQKIPSEDFPAIETEDPPTLKTEWPFPLPSWPAAFFSPNMRWATRLCVTLPSQKGNKGKIWECRIGLRILCRGRDRHDGSEIVFC